MAKECRRHASQALRALQDDVTHSDILEGVGQAFEDISQTGQHGSTKMVLTLS